VGGHTIATSPASLGSYIREYVKNKTSKKYVGCLLRGLLSHTHRISYCIEEIYVIPAMIGFDNLERGDCGLWFCSVRIYFLILLYCCSVKVKATLRHFFRQLRVCYFVAYCLTRGWVRNLLLLLVLASAVPQEVGSVLCQYQSVVSMYIRYLHKIFTLSGFDTVHGCIYNIYKASFSLGSVQQIMP
jgi:hypothetical protein